MIDEHIKSFNFLLERAFVDFMLGNNMNDRVGKIKASLKIFFSNIFKPYILHSVVTVHEVYRFSLYIKA